MAEGLKSVIAQLEQQKAAIERALAALQEVEAAPAAVTAKRRGRPPGVKSKAPAKRKGGITAEGRKRLSEMMRKRWAAKKAAPAGKGRKKSA